jgi:hypothetical protein
VRFRIIWTVLERLNVVHPSGCYVAALFEEDAVIIVSLWIAGPKFQDLVVLPLCLDPVAT